jgi:hypothetical protein
MKRLSIICVLVLIIGVFGFAEDDLSDENLDSLFEDETMVEEGTEQSGTSPETDFLVSETMRLGGRLISSFESSWMWSGNYPAFTDLLEPDISAQNINFGANLFFDARPKDGFRVFGKLKAVYPFNFSPVSSEADINIVELFTDFDYNDFLYFRVGKHTIKWGEGYFFSPADVLNVTSIDPENPEAQRECPLSVKMNVPFGLHNIYLYLIADELTTRLDEIAIAPKFEFVLGNLEMGIGGFYKKDFAPRGVLTATLPFWNFNFFGEAVVSYGSDKTFIERTDDITNYPQGVKPVHKMEDWFFSGTAGFSLVFIDPDPSISVIGQYFYNGEGYSDPEILKEPGVASLIADGQLIAKDLLKPGKHYGAADISWNNILDSDFGVSVFWMGNLSDGSGQVRPSVNWNIFKYVSLSCSMPIFYGDEGDEFTPTGKGLGFSLTASLAGRKKF